jgi:hypothetical protein
VRHRSRCESNARIFYPQKSIEGGPQGWPQAVSTWGRRSCRPTTALLQPRRCKPRHSGELTDAANRSRVVCHVLRGNPSRDTTPSFASTERHICTPAVRCVLLGMLSGPLGPRSPSGGRRKRPRHAAAAADADSSATHLTALVEAPAEAAPRRTYATNLLILPELSHLREPRRRGVHERPTLRWNAAASPPMMRSCCED